MTYIAHDIQSFLKGTILHPTARVKVKGDHIVFITSKTDKVKEGLKDFGRLLGNGLSIRNFNSASNRDVVAKLVEFRQQALRSDDPSWASFGTGRGRLIKPDATTLTDPVKGLIKDVLNERNPGTGDQVFSDPTGLAAVLAKAYRYEKRVWAYSNGFQNTHDTWSRVINSELAHGNSTGSLNLILQQQQGRINSALIYADDVDTNEFETRVTAHQAVIAQAASASELEQEYDIIQTNEFDDEVDNGFEQVTDEEIQETQGAPEVQEAIQEAAYLDEIYQFASTHESIGINDGGLRTFSSYKELLSNTDFLKGQIKIFKEIADQAIARGENHSIPFKNFKILSDGALRNIAEIAHHSDLAKIALNRILKEPEPTNRFEAETYHEHIEQFAAMAAKDTEYFIKDALAFESLVKTMEAHLWNDRGEPRPTSDLVAALGPNPLNHPSAERSAERILAHRPPVSFDMTDAQVAESQRATDARRIARGDKARSRDSVQVPTLAPANPSV